MGGGFVILIIADLSSRDQICRSVCFLFARTAFQRLSHASSAPLPSQTSCMYELVMLLLHKAESLYPAVLESFNCQGLGGGQTE